MPETKCNVCKNNLVLDEEHICAQCELSNDKGKKIPNTNNVNCGTCDVIVEEDSEGLYCDVCNKWYHNACCENPLLEDLYCLLNEAPKNVIWFCDKCIWETEKWIKSLKEGIITEINDAESDKAINDTDLHDQDISDNEGEIKSNFSLRDIKPRKRDRPRRLNAAKNSFKTLLETDPEYDYSKEPEVKIEIQNEDMPFGFDDRQSTDSEDYEERKIVNKKKKHGFQKKPLRNQKRTYCDLCSKGFLKPEDLVAHKLWHSGDKKPFKCTICDSSFAQKGQLKTHIATHSDDKPFICEICAKRFKWKSALKRHLNEIHSDDKPHQCSICDYRTANKSNIDTHMLKHTDDKPFQCTECDYTGKTANYLKQHMITHSDEKPFKCLECDKAFTRADVLKTHMFAHTGQRPFECTKCDAKFAKKIRLVIHMRIHTGERPYPCTICDYRAIQKNALICHMQVHSGVKPFVCDICGKQVRDSTSLKQHTLIHTGEKPLKCELCGKRFRAPGTLRVHMMYHNKTMKHFCPQCGYGSPTRDKLKLHIETVHTNETPYECDMCGNRYKTRGNLSKHKRGVRGSCQGANSGNFAKHPKLGKNLQKEQKPELTPFPDQEPDANRFSFKPLSDQAQAHIRDVTRVGDINRAHIKPKDTISQHHYQEPATSMHNIASQAQSYQTPPPLLYAGIPNNNSQYHGLFIHPTSIDLTNNL